MGGALSDPKRPFVAILGGAKVSDKIGVITNLLDKVDTLIIGGGMAYTFMNALGYSIGTSICENDKVELARRTRWPRQGQGRQVPDSRGQRGRHEYKADADYKTVDSDNHSDGWMGLDIGPRPERCLPTPSRDAGTVVWNGPMGVSEWENFAAAPLPWPRRLLRAAPFPSSAAATPPLRLKSSALPTR